MVHRFDEAVFIRRGEESTAHPHAGEDHHQSTTNDADHFPGNASLDNNLLCRRFWFGDFQLDVGKLVTEIRSRQRGVVGEQIVLGADVIWQRGSGPELCRLGLGAVGRQPAVHVDCFRALGIDRKNRLDEFDGLVASCCAPIRERRQ